MLDYNNIPKKQFYRLTSAIAVLLLFLSLDVLMQVKDVSLYQNWLVQIGKEANINSISDDPYRVYVLVNMLIYIGRVIIPVGFVINLYIAYVKTRINKTFIIIWTVLMSGNGIYYGLMFNFQSFFYYVVVLLQIIVVGLILTLFSIMNEVAHSRTLDT